MHVPAGVQQGETSRQVSFTRTTSNDVVSSAMNAMHSDHAQQREQEADETCDHHDAQCNSLPVWAVDSDSMYPFLGRIKYVK